MRKVFALAMFAALTASATRSALAQPVDAATKAAARQLGEEGMKLYDRGECAPAAEKLTRAHELVHVPTLAFYAGKCLEKLGLLVDASERYLDATRDPIEPGAPAAQKAARADAETARNALLPRLGAVEITLSVAVQDAALTLDGKAMPAAMLGLKRPIDPGDHAVEVRRGTGLTTKRFSIKEGESLRVVAEVPATPYPPAAYPPGAYPPAVAPYAYPPGYVPQPIVRRTKRRSTALFVTGVVLIPVGSIATLGGLVVAAQTSRAGGVALVGLGLVGLGAGIALTVVGGKQVPIDAPAHAQSRITLEPVIGPTSGGLRLTF